LALRYNDLNRRKQEFQMNFSRVEEADLNEKRRKEETEQREQERKAKEQEEKKRVEKDLILFEITTSEKDALVSKMVQQTNQDTALCHFLLESSDWDLEKAIAINASTGSSSATVAGASSSIPMMNEDQRRSKLVEQMALQTAQDSALCRYFLESSDWDLQKAISFTSNQQEHDRLLERMMTETSQGRDVCLFYLESSEWNIDKAKELLNQFTG